MATARTMFCDFLLTENSSEKSGGRATVTLNSTRLTASSWIPAVRIPSSWLRIVGTGACKPSVWTAHIFAPLKTIHGSVCRVTRSEEHTSELQSRLHLVCRLLLEKKKNE